MPLLRWILTTALFSLSWALTSPPSGALVVRQSGTKSGEYSTVSAAVAALGPGTSSKTIFIYPGTYKEQVYITYGGPLTIYGYSTNGGSYKDNEVAITNNLNAQDNGGNDPCATVRAHSKFFKMYNVNIANTYGPGKQATALSAKNSNQGYYGCKITGYQDTLLADGPGYQYYSNCYIEGAVDYIYGKASAWFGECTLSSNGPGAITANSRESSSDPGYYVIDSSTITSSASGLTQKVYLGRPWRALARVSFQRSTLLDLINPKGYTTLADNATPIFMEYQNTGAGADTSQRVTFTKQTALITHEQVLGSDYASWIDTSF
ncbi:pectinesterase a [Moniliophthora roreri MCA 2997]|uniref:pectinesterase n=1 Tax=Moniliophthora roreri (strain MCA 2997) TaxID=1381753 RepID=V2X0X3_MONRO|nr:pectinesterase a [Moniliophthora roreri MCA 2997]